MSPTYVPTCHQLCSHSIQVYATPCEFPCIADYILNSKTNRILEVKPQRPTHQPWSSLLHTFVFHIKIRKISFTHWTIAIMLACTGHTSLHTFLTRHKQQMVLENMHVLPTLKLGKAKHWLENHSHSMQQSGQIPLHSEPAQTAKAPQVRVS